MKKILSIFTSLFAAVFTLAQTVPSNDENYVFSTVYLNEDKTKKTETVQYFDGLGRVKQIVEVKASPSEKDIVTQIVYDALGRQDKSFLPMPQLNTTDGKIYSPSGTPYTESVGATLYGGTAPYFTKNEIENSPLSRPLSTTAPGVWSQNNKKVILDYKFNQAGEVKKYVTTTTWTDGRTSSDLSYGTYTINQLYKNIITDEDNNVSIEFKDKLGQTILIRKILSATEKADTYYVYNEYQDLVYVIPPLASIKQTLTQEDLNELCYQYRYDIKNRLVEKKLPGKGYHNATGEWYWELMVYDNQDRLVMTQDPNMFTENKWLFTKYDKFGRIVYTGITIDSGSRSTIQSTLDGKGSNNANRTTGGTSYPGGVLLLYENDSSKNYPNTIDQLLSVNYYDTYPAGSPAAPASILGQIVLPQNAQTSYISTKSLPTVSLVKNVEDDSWTKTYLWYDTKGNVIKTHTANHLGGYTKTELLLDFSGIPKEVYAYQKRVAASAEVVIKETFEYDSQNRLITHKHQVNNGQEEILSRNEYNEIGQLKTKKVGGTDIALPLQTIDYTYNVRGWMTGINNPENLGTDLFGYKLNFNNALQGLALPNADVSTPVEPRWNGNVAEILWKTSDDANIKRYGFIYDRFNRLLAGLYQGRTDQTSKEYSERMTYDLSGNIITLKRSSYFMGTAANLIDDLDYHYTGNRLTSVDDLSYDDNGYEGGGSPIAYDPNGNMADMPDKGISHISYNYLNLPNETGAGDGITTALITNTYRSDGVKVRKENTTTTYGIVGISTQVNTTDYLNGFQYLTTVQSGNTGDPGGIGKDSKLSVAMEQEAFMAEAKASSGGGTGTDDAVLQFVPTAEGFYDFIENRYIYQYKDHLGNARVTYAETSAGVLEILDKNDYYPFGMNHLDANSGSFFGQSSYKNYKYNGKELQETGMYDYGARMYMPDLGRWGVIDPLAEKDRKTSPFVYAFNNPIRFIDPDGREGEEAASSDSGSGGETGAGGNTDRSGNETVDIGLSGIKMELLSFLGQKIYTFYAPKLR